MSIYLPDSEFGTPNVSDASSRIDAFAQEHGLKSSELTALLASVTSDLFPDPQKIEATRVDGGKKLATTGKLTSYGTHEDRLVGETVRSRSDQLSGAQRAIWLGNRALAALHTSLTEQETPAIRLVSSDAQPSNDTHTPEISTPHAA